MRGGLTVHEYVGAFNTCTQGIPFAGVAFEGNALLEDITNAQQCATLKLDAGFASNINARFQKNFCKRAVNPY
jgi:hypothetical protein